MNLLRKIDWINVFLSFQKVPLTAVKMKHTSWKSQKWPLIRVYQPMSGVKDGKVALALKCVTTTASWMMRICSWTAECDKLNLTLRVVSSRGGDGVTKSGGWHISGGWHFPRGETSWIKTSRGSRANQLVKPEPRPAPTYFAPFSKAVKKEIFVKSSTKRPDVFSASFPPDFPELGTEMQNSLQPSGFLTSCCIVVKEFLQSRLEVLKKAVKPRQFTWFRF